jgi:hypothetical protein
VVDRVIEKISGKSDQTAKTITKKIERLTQFKATVSVDLIDFCQRAEAIKTKFREFTADEENKFNYVPLLI